MLRFECAKSEKCTNENDIIETVRNAKILNISLKLVF